MTSRKSVVLASVAGICATMLAGAQVPVRAQSPAAPTPTPTPVAQQIVPCPPQLQPLLPVPEIKSDDVQWGSAGAAPVYAPAHRFKATIKLLDAKRTMWNNAGDQRCFSQSLRYLTGTADPAHATAWPSGPDPIPGPTLRARVGDLVEITFFNEVNPAHFSFTSDRGDVGSTTACDQYNTNAGTNVYGKPPKKPTDDQFPDCLHGSSTTNLHFHGTHTNPGSTGDNVLLFIRPAPRTNVQPGTNGQLQPSEAQYTAALGSFFNDCETSYKSASKPGWPTVWTQMPGTWQTFQKNQIQQYDTNAGLPQSSQLWGVNESELGNKPPLWPQYNIGAVPFCFPLPKYEKPMLMGQSPGTHWYHAHKHGSTALNVANGMTGALIIEGQYDDDLHGYYKNHQKANLKEQVLVVQQMSAAPFPLTNPRGFQPGGPGAPKPPISVNGRINPVLSMHPGEVQLWRVVNGAFRDAIQFAYFANTNQPTSPTPTPPNSCLKGKNPAPAAAPGPHWRQLAQDGVQFNYWNYRRVGSPDARFNLSPANRADVLLQAPTKTGVYTLCVVRSNGLTLDVPNTSPGSLPKSPSALLTVNVSGSGPRMTFIPDGARDFPLRPVPFLGDIGPIPPDKPDAPVKRHKFLTFGATHNLIDNKTFQDNTINQNMRLDTSEEWVVKNEAGDKRHPFHIHINPFQIVELFEPNAPAAMTKGNPCYVNPDDPDTFDPARKTFKDTCVWTSVPNPRVLPPPWVWWDTFAIPASRTITLTCTTIDKCPQNLKPYISCGGGVCTELIDGWFRMRSNFVDYTGLYVLHCHILVHEDRGMMQLIEVIGPGEPPHTHTIESHH